MNRLYSVIIPAFNAERTLAAAIDSVLSQTFSPATIIVVDDGSTDQTACVARFYAPRVIVLRQSNCGPGAATTRGLEVAKTPFIATLDADDIWLRDKVTRQLDRFDQDPSLHAVFGRVQLFRHLEAFREDAPTHDNWGRTTMMIRREAALSIGPIIDPPNRCGDMIDWISRARESNMRLELMLEVLALRRIVPGSLSDNCTKRGEGYLHVVRAALERKKRKARSDFDSLISLELLARR
jgi:glycosyltransferase involved in cell wall biosynthesis